MIDQLIHGIMILLACVAVVSFVFLLLVLLIYAIGEVFEKLRNL